MHSSLPLLVIPGIVVLLSILAAALLLRGRKKTPVRKSIEVQRLGEPEAQGNIYVSDGEGHTVRRSTRQRKTIASPELVSPSPARTKVKTEGVSTPTTSQRSARRTSTPGISTPTVATTPEKNKLSVSPKIRSRRTPRV